MKKTLFLCMLFLMFAPLWGGVSPKPEMDFSFSYQTAGRPAVLPNTSEQIQCEDNQCIQQIPLGKYGIQKLYCKADGCFSIAYEYKPYQKLVIDFADGVKRQSNVFPTPAKLRNAFNVTVRENDLLVELSPKPLHVNALLRADAWTSLIIILFLEILAALAYLAYTGKNYKVVYSVVLANLISMPLTWQVLGSWVTESAFLWFFSLIFEGLFIWACNRRRLSVRNAFALSVAVNVTSYSVGMMICFLLAPYLF